MSESPTPERPPRAFCQATGFVYQTIGFLLTLGTCCWWSFAGRVATEARPSEPGRQVVDVMTDASPAQLWGLTAVCASFVGGLVLVAAGIALQHDMSASGRFAKWFTGAVAAFFTAYSVMCIATFPGWGRTPTALVMAGVWIVMFLLAGASAEELRRNPPPKRDSSWTPRDEDDLRKAASLRRRDETSR
ncbi:MAG: hypothetical protein HZA51_18665 [Planctomycetes bacterium]|nr:hypothetical protein [Planctomycetota bacterium]